MNNNTEHSEEFNQYISFYDLEVNEPEWQEAWKSQDKDRVEALLYKWGCDINYGWDISMDHLFIHSTTRKPSSGIIL